jgi:hypothetical protein
VLVGILVAVGLAIVVTLAVFLIREHLKAEHEKLGRFLLHLGWMLGVVMLIGGILIVRTVHTSSTSALDPHPDSTFHLAALGDSYTSGEGARHFFPGTDNPSNGCRRASTAYPYLVAKQDGYSLTFLACSGAVTRDVDGLASPPRLQGEGQYPDSPRQIAGRLPQLVALQQATTELRSKSGRGFNAVILGIGGNDAKFGEVGKACAMPGRSECLADAQDWLDNIRDAVYPALTRTYREVKTAADGAPVFVTTYPDPLGPGRSCIPGIDNREYVFLRDDFIPFLDAIIERAAAVTGVRVIDLSHAFDGKRLCQVPFGNSDLNVIGLGATLSLRQNLARLRNLGHDSFHPNERGHVDIATKVEAALRAWRSGDFPVPASEPDRPPAEPDPAARANLGSTKGFDFAGTGCPGPILASIKTVSIPRNSKVFTLTGAHSFGRTCYRQYGQAGWRHVTNDSKGTAAVPVRVKFKGIASENLILAQQPDDSWAEAVVVGDNAEPATRQISYLTWSRLRWFVLGIEILAIVGLGALLWRERRRVHLGQRTID